MEPESYQNPYARLIERLQTDGLINAARKLDFLFREITWTANADFINAFGAELQHTQHAYGDRMSEATRQSFSEVAKLIGRHRPDLKL